MKMVLHPRLFCRWVCPLGWLQSGVRLWRGPRRVCTRLPESRRQRIARWSVLALYVAGFLVSALYVVKPFLDPYAIVCRAVAYTFFSPERDAAVAAVAFVPLAAVLAVSLATRGRGWCNWVCPWGTVLNALSQVLPFGDKVSARGGCVGKECDTCRKCFR